MICVRRVSLPFQYYRPTAIKMVLVVSPQNGERTVRSKRVIMLHLYLQAVSRVKHSGEPTGEKLIGVKQT